MQVPNDSPDSIFSTLIPNLLYSLSSVELRYEKSFLSSIIISIPPFLLLYMVYHNILYCRRDSVDAGIVYRGKYNQYKAY